MEADFSFLEQDGRAGEFELLAQLLLHILNDVLGGSVRPFLGLLDVVGAAAKRVSHVLLDDVLHTFLYVTEWLYFSHFY